MQSPPTKPTPSSLEKLIPFFVIAGFVAYAGLSLRLRPDRQDKPDDYDVGERKVKLLPGDVENQLQIRTGHREGNAEFKALQVGMTFAQVRKVLHVGEITHEDRVWEIVSANVSQVSFVSSDNSAIEVLLRHGIVAEKHHLSQEMRAYTEQLRKPANEPE